MVLRFSSRTSSVRLLRKLGSLFLSLSGWIWTRLPPSLQRSSAARRYGRFIHKLVLIRGWREPNHGTYFLRNRPELELIHKIAGRRPAGSIFRIAVLGCSNGMEVYSIRWQLRDLAPLLDFQLVGLDIDEASIDTARSGVYTLPKYARMLIRLTDAERLEIFEIKDGAAHVRPHLRQGIQWFSRDVCSPSLHELLDKQDLVLANRFLCHMAPERAGACLRNVTQLVAPGGYLFVSGVDLPVRQSVLHESGFVPVTDGLAAIHDGDPSLRECWPLQTCGLEPLDAERADWVARYAMVYCNEDQRKESHLHDKVIDGNRVANASPDPVRVVPERRRCAREPASIGTAARV